MNNESKTTYFGCKTETLIDELKENTRNTFQKHIGSGKTTALCAEIRNLISLCEPPLPKSTICVLVNSYREAESFEGTLALPKFYRVSRGCYKLCGWEVIIVPIQEAIGRLIGKNVVALFVESTVLYSISNLMWDLENSYAVVEILKTIGHIQTRIRSRGADQPNFFKERTKAIDCSSDYPWIPYGMQSET